MITDASQMLASLTQAIFMSVTSLESERHYPGADSDRSDERIAAYKERIANLRRIREELEVVFSDPRC